LRNRLYFAGECLPRPKTKYFGKRCRFGKEVVGVSAVPTGLGSLSSHLPRISILGYRMPPPTGLEYARSFCLSARTLVSLAQLFSPIKRHDRSRASISIHVDPCKSVANS
jgi:hypothetical protein